MQRVGFAQVWELSHLAFILDPSLILQATSGYCLEALFFPVLWDIKVVQSKEGENPVFT